MGSFVSLMLLASFSVSAVPRVDTGALIEQAVIGLMCAAAAGFLTGELAWIAAPEISDTTYPLRTKQRAAVAAAYSVGVPFGSALGVHVSGLAMGRKTPFWPKWVGAELGVLAAGGISLLILSKTKADTAEYNPHLVDRPLEVLAAALPVVAGVSGAFLGSWLAHKLGWAGAGVPPVRIGLYPAGDGFAVSCKLCLSF